MTRFEQELSGACGAFLNLKSQKSGHNFFDFLRILKCLESNDDNHL